MAVVNAVSCRVPGGVRGNRPDPWVTQQLQPPSASWEEAPRNRRPLDRLMSEARPQPCHWFQLVALTGRKIRVRDRRQHKPANDLGQTPLRVPTVFKKLSDEAPPAAGQQ